MSGSSTTKASVVNALKIYLFPSLVTVLAMMIWRDVTEMRSDIKALLAQANVDKTEIQNLKRDVQTLNHQVFKIPVPIAMDETKHESSDYLAVHDQYFKHEDIFDVNNYLPKTES